MKRLPTYDRSTSRAEGLAFLSLALLTLPLIVFAVREAGCFSENRDAIAAALTRPAPAVMVAGEKTGTNVAMQGMPTATTRQPVTFKPAYSPRS
jgi:hypothetical protein